MFRSSRLPFAGALLSLALAAPAQSATAVAPSAGAAGTTAPPLTGGTAVAPAPATGTAVAPGSIAIQPITTVEGGVSSWIAIGVEQWSGHNSYQIGYPVTFATGSENGYFPFSKLEFPLDVPMAALRVGVDFHDRIPVFATLKKPLTDPGDRMIDQDWITPENPTQLDIFSESEISSFDATVFDIDAGYKVLRGEQGWLAAGAGYLYQNFDYEVRLIRQWSPSGQEGFDFLGDGRTALAYEISYQVPYVQLRGEFRPTPQALFQARVAYSPWVTAEDHDQHLLRYKDNKGDLDGDFLSLTLAGRYQFTPHWFVSAGYEYTRFDLDGTMNSELYGVYDHTVTEKVESSQSVIFLTAGYLFGPGGK